MKKKRILFINFGGLGDEILFLPTIHSVKAQYPETEITLALEERSKSITQLTNIIDETLTVNFKHTLCNNKIDLALSYLNKINELIKMLFKIWGKNYDLVIASGGNKLMFVILAMTLIPKRIGYNTGKLSEKLLTRAVTLNKNQYAVDMLQDLITPITDIRTDLPILSIEKRNTIPNSVLIHPGVSKVSISKGIIKTIQPVDWAKVVLLLANSGKKVILAGGPDDRECIEQIQLLVPQEKYTNMYGKTKNIKELAELISSAESFLCSDSAPLHIGVALGVKTYVIFGSTDDKKLIPQSDRVIPIKNNYNCPLRPCLWERRQTSCEGAPCLKISAEEIVQEILKY